MDEVIALGWTRVKKEFNTEVSEKDLKTVFKMVDMDKNGVICNIVSILKRKKHMKIIVPLCFRLKNYHPYF
jgi:hypothetical protein